LHKIGRVTNWAADRTGIRVCLFMAYFAKLPESQAMWDDWYMQKSEGLGAKRS